MKLNNNKQIVDSIMPKSNLDVFSIVYLVIPVLLFIFGWCNFYISIPISVLIVIVMFRFIKNSWSRNNNYKFNKRLLVVFIISALFVYVSGIGGYVYQNTDHLCRNEILNILVREN